MLNYWNIPDEKIFTKHYRDEEAHVRKIIFLIDIVYRSCRRKLVKTNLTNRYYSQDSNQRDSRQDPSELGVKVSGEALASTEIMLKAIFISKGCKLSFWELKWEKQLSFIIICYPYKHSSNICEWKKQKGKYSFFLSFFKESTSCSEVTYFINKEVSYKLKLSNK